MLILTRRTNEAIQIGDDIVVTVLRVEEGRVKIGIRAPEDVLIRRTEVPPEAPPLPQTAPRRV